MRSEMNTRIICAVLLAILPLQTYGFGFTLKPVGTTKITATPGEIITFNAHMTMSETTPLSFHASLPYFNTPIMNIEAMEVKGISKNLETQGQAISYSKRDATYYKSFSQGSVDFGNVTRNSSNADPKNDVVVQVQARLLEHSNVTKGKVLWMYFGVQYKQDSIWVIGKSITVDLQPGPAKIGVDLQIPRDALHTTEAALFIIVYHLPGSKISATDLTITLSIPNTFAVSSGSDVQQAATLPTYDVTLDDNVVIIKFTSTFAVGQKANLKAILTPAGSNSKGMYISGNIYGSFTYDTLVQPGCSTTVTKKGNLQVAFKFYSPEDTCDNELTLDYTDVKASSAFLPCCPAKGTDPAEPNLFWEPWSYNGIRLADEYIQVDFAKKTTVKRIYTTGFEKNNKFVKSFYVSHSQNSIHWDYVTTITGMKEEFKGNTNSLDRVMTVFSKPFQAWHLRIHVVKRGAAGASLKLKVYGCESSDTKDFEFAQRQFLFVNNEIYLCNVHPDKKKGKPSCYFSADGLTWETMHPSIINLLGLSQYKIYAMGLSSANTPSYMRIDGVQSVQLVDEAVWTAGSAGAVKPMTIPFHAVHGAALYEIPGTVAGDYSVSPEGLLKKNDDGSVKMIASWVEMKIDE